MNITWYGHSTFLLSTAEGLRILMDPCGPQIGYRLHDIEADVVTMSHDHHDHNYLAAVAGSPRVLRAEGATQIGGARITGIASFHDDAGGTKRGKNLIFLIEADNLRVAHLGDLGHIPSDAAFSALGSLDAILAPIGGTYTIVAQEALAIADRAHTRMLVPMHYQTPALTLGAQLLGVDTLLSQAKSRKLVQLDTPTIALTPEALAEETVTVPTYVR